MRFVSLGRRVIRGIGLCLGRLRIMLKLPPVMQGERLIQQYVIFGGCEQMS